jgi:hypothetical protein
VKDAQCRNAAGRLLVSVLIAPRNKGAGAKCVTRGAAPEPTTRLKRLLVCTKQATVDTLFSWRPCLQRTVSSNALDGIYKLDECEMSNRLEEQDDGVSLELNGNFEVRSRGFYLSTLSTAAKGLCNDCLTAPTCTQSARRIDRI